MTNKLTMKNDIVFKAFFNRNEKYLKSFLSAILGKKVKIKRVIHDARLEQLSKEMKFGILDLEVELEDGEIVNIEMQLRDNQNIEERTTFYASKKIVEQLEPKGKYEELKKVIVISILNYTLIDLPEYVTETVRVARNHKEYELNNVVKYYYIELNKFRKQKPNMKEEVNQWLTFIDMG
jgi:predicted transposase/invertase (TIGR01784 family)